MSFKYSILNKYVFLVILCIFICNARSRHKALKAPQTLSYNDKDVMRANIILKNIPKDKDYNYTVYNTERVASRGTLMEGEVIEISSGGYAPSLSSTNTYYIKLGTESGLECEPVTILTAVYSQTYMKEKKCLENKVCEITVDLKETCDEEIFDLSVEVISPKHDNCDDDVLCYNVGDKLRVLCSEKTKNKPIHLQWNIRKGNYYDFVTWKRTNNIYNVYFEMDLKRFDSDASVYCSAVAGSGKTLHRSRNIELKAIGEPTETENMNVIQLDNAASPPSLYCKEDQKEPKDVTSYNGSVLYCVNYKLAYMNTTKEDIYIDIVRETYNETMYYINEKETQSIKPGTIIGVGVAIILIVLAIVSFALYRRRLRSNIQDSVIYSTVNEIVYAQLQMPEATSNLPQNKMDRPQYAEVIGVLAPKQTQRNLQINKYR